MTKSKYERRRAVVAAGHPQTAEAAKIALEAGGNAFDAIIAAGWAACVTEPVLASIGGGGFLMASPKGQSVTLYDYCAQTPQQNKSSDDVEFVRIVVPFGTTSQEFHVGSGSAATPGMVAGLFRIHRDLATLPMSVLVEPAVRWARQGVVVNRLQAYLFAITAAIFRHSADSERVYGSEASGQVPIAEGERLRLPELADTLAALASEGEALFYRGALANQIAAFSRDTGGLLSATDLEQYRVETRAPLTVTYRDSQLALNPPPASGGALVAFGLKLLESVDLSGLAADGGAFLRVLAGVMRQTNQARARVYDGLEHEEGAESVLLHDDTVAHYAAALAPPFEQTRGTTHVSIIDDAGNVASMTNTNGEGCGRMVPGTGVMLNNMLGEEDVHPHGFDRWPVDTRISSMMCPAIATDRSRTIATGSGGSTRIRTCVLQVLVKLLDFHRPVAEAVNSPRLHLEGSRLAVEGGFSPAQIAELRRDFAELQIWDEKNLYFGGAHTVVHDRETGSFAGAGDERRGGAVVVLD